jgi:DnaJ-class molecular chaperone
MYVCRKGTHDMHLRPRSLFTQTKQQPVAVCTACGAFGYNTRNIGARCGKPDGGRRCMGVRARATDSENWVRCPKCAGTGRIGDDRCDHCASSGWLYVRRAVSEAPQV